MLKDNQQRSQAIDPRFSFIVQAPAGSGKTEILTQRYLRLLSHVGAPEQIIALTFTRKAASEMRERILRTLQHVANGVEATSAHQQTTFNLAAEALKRSTQQDWNILQQSGRLRILTIDSFCQMLTHAIPLSENQIPYAKISDNPYTHYRSAAQAFFNQALNDETLQPWLSQLLDHLDNRQDKLLEFFCELLAKRDQWLTNLYSVRHQNKAHYEQMLAYIEQHELARFQQCIPINYQKDLCSIANEMARLEANPQSPRYALSNWNSFDQLTGELAKSLASLLLTSQNTLRKRFDHHVGLKRDNCEAKRYKQLKLESEELLTQLASEPNFLERLVSVKNLPSAHYDPQQWQVLQALFKLLPILVAHLQMAFNEHDEVDFTAIAQQAFFALGDDEQPTDLAFCLDNQIHHLLVDEFQDTSIQQFNLLSKLVRGWEPGDGKTLFIVGDPMQSIYRFRQAEVGLFIRAKNYGIGPINLVPLELTCNFRSTEAIVNWINQQFTTLFPTHDDIESGAISFHPSIAIKQVESLTTFIKAQQCSNRISEAQNIINCVKKEQKKNPTDEIAILVRSRTQLSEIIYLLRKQEIPFQGVDIESLSQLPHLRDLWSLTQALLQPANRLAWLAFLRSPWCGLDLNDLHAVANFSPRKSIYYALSNLEKIEALSSSGRKRAQFIFNHLQVAFAERYQPSFILWLRSILKHFHMESILEDNQQADLEQFWLLLDRHTTSGQLPNLAELQVDFDQLYSQQVTTSRLHIMTIHKSKGLEFDCVILPSLGAKNPLKDIPLLRWLKLPSTDYDDLVITSPIKSAASERCPVYDYIGRLEAEKDCYELQRLLYVAVTRAKKRLYLFDSSSSRTLKGSFRGLLKQQQFTSESPESALTLSEEGRNSLLYRLPEHYYRQLPSPPSIDSSSSPDLLALNDMARQLGIVTHELLQWICSYHPSTIEELPWQFIDNRFRSLGFSAIEQKQAYQTLQQQIKNLFKDPIGKWLMNDHSNARNEYELLILEKGLLQTKIIDRTFTDQGFRWIIDFKTGEENFYSCEQHRHQVNRYAHLLATRTEEPIRCGLYYLATNNWIHWHYSHFLEKLT